LLNRDSALQPARGLVIQPYLGVASVGATGSF